MEIIIKPVTKTLDKLYINDISIDLNKDARISVGVMGDEIGLSYLLKMDSETYKNWGTDDEYVVNWVLEQLGLEKA